MEESSGPWPSANEVHSTFYGDTPEEVSQHDGVKTDSGSLHDYVSPEDEYHTYHTADSFASGLQHGELMNHKIPPSFGGTQSWFAFEELVHDWEDTCTLDKKHRGPALKNRLYGEASIYKTSLDRETLKQDDGVEYFLKTLRPMYVKGAQAVFLYRLIQFQRLRRGRLDISKWLVKWALMRQRLRDSWMDLIQTQLADIPAHPQAARLEAKVNAQVRAMAPPDRPDVNDPDVLIPLMAACLTAEHEAKFPYNENLLTLLFLIASELTENQRSLLTSHLALRRISVENYTWEVIRELYMELLLGPKTTLDDPNVKPMSHSHGGNRTFCVLEELGELDGVYTGYWVEDEESGLVGFLDENEDDFYTLQDNGTWLVRGFKGRKMHRRPPRRKGKGKGREGRG